MERYAPLLAEELERIYPNLTPARGSGIERVDRGITEFCGGARI